MKLQLCLLFVLLGSLNAKSVLTTSKPPLLSLYYESLCPGCHAFITTQLVPTYEKLDSLIDIELVPYGNAMEVNGTIECQHGPNECYGNVVQACLLAENGGDAKQSLTFITCMIEQPNSDDTHSSAKKCATDLRLDWSSLSNCANGPEGARLIAANKAKTDALQPAHQYVPWILIDGVHTEDLENKCLANLLGYLCKNYLSKNQPECKQADLAQTMPAEKCLMKFPLF